MAGNSGFILALAIFRFENSIPCCVKGSNASEMTVIKEPVVASQVAYLSLNFLTNISAPQGPRLASLKVCILNSVTGNLW